jgi:L-histidine Nalpha-methyltransferase
MPDGFQAIPAIASEALAGLSSPRKTLPAKLFYDEEGCRLFGEITRLPEYYVTRTEHALLKTIGSELVTEPGVALVEYGASDEAKAAMVLQHVDASAYVPIDVAQTALDSLVTRMGVSHPALEVYPIAADFMEPLQLPHAVSAMPRLGFFPGSTIGNFEPDAAVAFLSQVHATLGDGATLLVGVDLRKDQSILVPAYDDAQGVTAAFNLNLLARLNREVGADFDLDGFRHRAVWNDAEGRIEMHLESTRAQTAMLAGTSIGFAAGETIHTENSYKHTIEGFQALARSAGWEPMTVWTDPAGMVSLHLLRSFGVVPRL